jgi:tryptophan-rich sensory protein
VFGIAWTALYILMGLAAYRVYEKTGWPSWALQVVVGVMAGGMGAPWLLLSEYTCRR